MRTLLKLGALLLVLSALFGGRVGAEAPLLSPGLEVIRGETKLVKCCVNGERVTFTDTEFASLTGAEFEYITLTRLPELKEGVLKLAGVDVLSGQHISRSGLKYLKFVPNSSFDGDSGFTFTVAAEGWESKEIDCVIRFSETENLAPIAVSASFETYKSVSLSAPLGAYDPDGDAISYKVKQYPSSGRLSIDGGVATYTPIEGFVGADSFTYCITDSFGNESETVRADLRVTESKSGIYFADMKDKTAHLAAIRAAEEQVMTYTLIGDSYYFTPEEQVSRIDFAVMLVCAADAAVPDKLYPTDIFTDTGSQSRDKRLYLETAVTKGFIKVEGDTFRPDEPITVTEAVAMTENALGESLISIGSAYFEDAERCLTKEDAAVLLTALY